MCFSSLWRMLDLSWSQVVSYFSKDFLLVSTDFGPGSQTYAGAVHRMPKRQTLRWSFRLWTCPAHVRFMCTFQARTDDRLSSECTTVEEGNILGSFPYSLWRGDSGSCSSDMLRLGCRELVWRVWSKLNNKSLLYSEQSLLWKAWRANMNNEWLEASWSLFCVNFAMCKALDLRQGRFWLCVKAAQPPAASGTAICELPHYGPAMPSCRRVICMTGSWRVQMNLVEVEVASKLLIIWRGLVPEHGQQIGGAGWHVRQWYIEGTEAQRFRLADFPCRSWMCRKMRTVGSDVGNLWICDLNSLRLEWMELKYVEICWNPVLAKSHSRRICLLYGTAQRVMCSKSHFDAHAHTHTHFQCLKVSVTVCWPTGLDYFRELFAPPLAEWIQQLPARTELRRDSLLSFSIVFKNIQNRIFAGASEKPRSVGEIGLGTS